MSQARNGLVAACLLSILLAASPASAQPAPQPPPYPPRYAPRPAPTPKPPPVVYGWDPEAPAPDGYKVVDAPNGALIGTGIAMLSIGWTTSIVAGAIGAQAEANEEPDEIDAFTPTDWAPLYVPIGGPIAAIVTLKPSPGGLGLLLADTIVQVGGVLGIIAGILDRETRVVRTDYGVELDLPILTPGGAHVTGRFQVHWAALSARRAGAERGVGPEPAPRSSAERCPERSTRTGTASGRSSGASPGSCASTGTDSCTSASGSPLPLPISVPLPISSTLPLPVSLSRPAPTPAGARARDVVGQARARPERLG